jgi:flagellar basal-body rod modification protein FlgD
MPTTSVVSSVSDLPEVTGQSLPTSSGSNALGKDAFLRMLTEQLKNQDPTKPVENTQMVAQLAQFSQLEQLQTMTRKIDSMVTATAASNQLTTASLVGKQVRVDGNVIGLVSGKTSEFRLTLADASAKTSVVITNAAGNVVRTLDLGPQEAGLRSITWDGLDANGKPAPSGEYTLSVKATAADDSAVSASTSVLAIVAGVAYENGVAKLVVAGRRVNLSDVVEISAPPATPTGN